MLNCGEECFLTLHANRQPSPALNLSGFTVSINLDGSDQSFIKAAKSLTNTETAADLLVLRLLWKVTLTTDGKPTCVYGVRSITFPDSARSVLDICDTLREGVRDKFLITQLPLQPAIEEPLSFDVIDWSVEIDGDGGNIAWVDVNIVPMKLRLVCTSVMSRNTLFRVSVEFRTAVKSFPLGSRKQLLILSPGETNILSFTYCFMMTGMYNMAEFVSVKAVCDVIPELKVPKLQKPSSNQMLLQVG